MIEDADGSIVSAPGSFGAPANAVAIAAARAYAADALAPATLLWAHWGTTQALRGVVPVPGRGWPHSPNPGLWWVGFWSTDWTPWRAIQQLRTRRPTLRLKVRPLYDDP